MCGVSLANEVLFAGDYTQYMAQISCDPFFARSVPWYNAYAKKGHAVTNVRIRTCFTEEEECVADALTYSEGDLTLHASTAVLQYLAVVDEIVPKDVKEAARVDDAMAMVMMTAGKLFRVITAPLFFVKDSKARVAKGIKTVQPILQFYETLLSKQDYVAGDRLSLADFLFAPEVDQLLIVAPALQTQVLDGRVAIAAYLERMRQVDGYTAGFEVAKAYFEALQVPEKLAGVTSAVLERGHFVDAVDEELMCPLCHGVVVAPLQCKEGHVFCKGCIEKTLLEKGVCPVDRSALQVADLSPVLAVQAMVNRKRVRCPCAAQHTDEEDGCDWVGKVSERQKHLNTECGYTSVPCPHDGCEVRVQRRAVEEHAASCEQRVEACEHCGEGVAVSQRAQHEQVCPLAVVECLFKEVGCTAPSMPRKDAAAHARAAAEEHAALALAAQREARKAATARDALALQQVGSLTEQVAVQTEVVRLEVLRRKALERDLTAADERLSRSLQTASKRAVAVEWKIEGMEEKIAAGAALCSRAEPLQQSASAKVCPVSLQVAFTATDMGVFLRHTGVPSRTKVHLDGSSVTLVGASAARNRVGEFRHCVALGSGCSGWATFVSLAELRSSYIAEDGSITLCAKLCAAAVFFL